MSNGNVVVPHFYSRMWLFVTWRNSRNKTEIAWDWCGHKASFLIIYFDHHFTRYIKIHTICHWMQICGAACFDCGALYHPDNNMISWRSLFPIAELLSSCRHCDWRSCFRAITKAMWLDKSEFINHHTLWFTTQSFCILHFFIFPN